MSYETYLVVGIAWTLLTGYLGASWCAKKQRSPALGFGLGVGLGLIGLIVIAFLDEGMEEAAANRRPGWLTATAEAPAPVPPAPVVGTPKTWWRTENAP